MTDPADDSVADLAEREHFVRTVIASLGEGVIVYDRELRYRAWNRFMEELTGLAAAEVLGRHALELFPHLREQGIDQLFARALTGETVVSRDVPYHIPQTGRAGWVAAIYTPHRSAAGEVIGVVAVVRDITKRRQAEDALGESEERFARAFRASPAAITISTLADGRYVDVNESFLRAIGYARDEVVGRLSVEIGIWEDPADRTRMAEALREKGWARDLEFRFRTKTGEVRDFLVSGEIVDLGGQRCVLAISEDVTLRRRMEREREQLIAELQEALGRVRTLSGMLPICASCRKIRDDQGYWQKIEVYVREHSGAQFSHGLCPDCTRQLYPEQYRKLYPGG